MKGTRHEGRNNGTDVISILQSKDEESWLIDQEPCDFGEDDVYSLETTTLGRIVLM